MSKLICVQEYHDRMTAEIARSMLESNGIEAYAHGDDMGGTRPDMWTIGRVRLLVPAEAEEEARSLLAEVHHSSNEPPEVREYGEEGTKGVNLFSSFPRILLIIFLIILAVLFFYARFLPH